MVSSIQSNSISSGPITPPSPFRQKKTLLIALSILMALGMIFSYALGAPWFVIVGFFSLSLWPLFPFGKAIDDQRERIKF